ncbi:hypothetical protein EVAR_66154_1 [Eumeta japonica]|uniref:Uncharacterized protein n=1 Tax=Eumeta variegata TaxID=151549 RepID=A0A4C2A187_EUMVA|nr:hypothetical protein EVAR_66154_1 [Eumeta japonica]
METGSESGLISQILHGAIVEASSPTISFWTRVLELNPSLVHGWGGVDIRHGNGATAFGLNVEDLMCFQGPK